MTSSRGYNFCGMYKNHQCICGSAEDPRITRHLLRQAYQAQTFSSGTMSRETLVQKNLTHIANINVVQNTHYVFIPSIRFAKKREKKRDFVRKSVWIRFRSEWSLPFQVECFRSPDVGFSFPFGLIHCVVVCKRVPPQTLFTYLREAIQ